jgi:hypothetical protein
MRAAVALAESEAGISKMRTRGFAVMWQARLMINGGLYIRGLWFARWARCKPVDVVGAENPIQGCDLQVRG